MNTKPVLISGFGPVGAVLALALSRQGIPVIVFELEDTLVEDQRAATMHPPTLEMLDALDLTDTIIARGLMSPIARHWDRVTHSVIADFDFGLLKDDTPFPFAIQYEHYKLIKLIYERLQKQANVQVLLAHEVVSVDLASSDEVAVVCRSGNGELQKFTGSYLVAADGGRSIARRSAGIDFEGFTYPERFLKIMTSFDFAAHDSRYALRNFFSDPDEWCNLFKVSGDGPPGQWRVVFPTANDENEDQLLDEKNVQDRLRRCLSNSADCDILSLSVYHVHQKVASTFRRGRVLLVGDAAHLNNPIGGMGMNGGIHDAINLADKLSRVINQGAADDLLDLYDRQRRGVAVNFVQAQTIRNKKLLDERNPEQRQKNLDHLKRTADDPILARRYLRSASLIDSVEASYAIT